MKTTIVLLYLAFALVSLTAQTLRPVRDTVGFCRNAEEMNRFIDFLSETSIQETLPKGNNIVAAISPHDDYLYAGKVYYPLYKLIKAKEIVIFGVTHGTVRRAMNDPQNILILDDFDKWKGPYGNVRISPLRERIKANLNSQYFIVSNKAQSIEHSIEALIPFLQYYNRKLIITPIMVTKMPFETAEKISGELSGIITEYIKEKNYILGKDIFFLISNDANHYGEDFGNSPYGLDRKAHTEATDNDRMIINKNLNRGITDESLSALVNSIWESLNPNAPLWCGRYPIVFGMLTTQKITKELLGTQLKGKLLKYSDTLNEGVLPFKPTTMGLTAPASEKHWVGFFSEIFIIE